MKCAVETSIKECEEQLEIAMLHSDIFTLGELLSDDLIFTNHLGHVMTKQDDLAAHRSGMLKITELNASEQEVRADGTVAIVSVKVRIKGSYNGDESENDFRFTRVWRKNSNNKWQVIAAHSSRVA